MTDGFSETCAESSSVFEHKLKSTPQEPQEVLRRSTMERERVLTTQSGAVMATPWAVHKTPEYSLLNSTATVNLNESHKLAEKFSFEEKNQ